MPTSNAAPPPPGDFEAPSIPPKDSEFAIDLTAALRLAEAENPLIAEARQRIGEAAAALQGAQVLLLPSLNLGTTYHNHLGNLQRSSGRILDLREQSLYFGGGSDVFAASTVEVPAVSIFSPLTDAVFEPLAARQQVVRTRFDARATANSILLEVSQQYFELMATEAFLRVRRETAEQGTEVARLTRAYADAGEGRDADAERAATELSLIVVEVRQAEEEAAVAAARLAHRLHLDQAVRIRPIAPAAEVVTIVDPARTLPELLEAALAGRPEVGARSAAIDAAEYRHKQEQFRPLLPTLWVGFSAGGFGGGGSPFGTQLGNFGGRSDFDVSLFWTVRNLGMGNLSLQRRREAEVGQAVGERARTIAEVRAEVASAYASVAASRRQVDVTAFQLASAEKGFREDLDRIRSTVGRPIEVVNSLQLLNNARIARIRAVTDYNQAELRLFVALGSPPPLSGPADAPLPAAPIASPPLPPLAGLVAPGPLPFPRHATPSRGDAAP
ncbi:TolC family protein [Paludisphaera mucosa]|uniref:TolC family protein n=1 Tax=Paludisphaera mucosa TaxID=3030827 RepID=A0ABT6FLW6_9BACT|nr:TolC family protein [Paludisphaera mucosa]